MNTQPNIDRFVDDAIALADLCGPQTGTAPQRCVPNYDAPADQPVVEFEGEEEGRSINALFGMRAACLRLHDETEDGDDQIALMSAHCVFENRALKAPARTLDDLRLKLSIWTDLVNDSACILDHHPALWRVLLADIERLAGSMS